MLYTALYMPSTRTQIYLTAEQRRKLDSRRRRERKTLAAVVRDAVDAYVGKDSPAELRRTLDDTFGLNPRFGVPSRDEWRKRGRRS
jgi:hypothetical protein